MTKILIWLWDLKFKATINDKEQVNYIMLNYDQLTQIKPKRTRLNN